MNKKYPLNTSLHAILLAVSAAVLLGGCLSGQTGSDYGRSQVRGEQAIKIATVVSSRPVNIDGTRSGVGAMAGAFMGAIYGAGRSGNDTKSQILGTLGGVLGGAIGQSVEQATTKTTGIEVVVQYADGKMTAITQEDDGTPFIKGDIVRVMKQDGITRLARHE